MSPKSNFWSFYQARNWARALKLKSAREWISYVKAENFPEYIPRTPNTVYKEEWRGYSDWLGIKEVVEKGFITFEKAKALIDKHNIRSRAAYFNLANKKGDQLPKSPHIFYKNAGWKGWADYLSIEDYSNKISTILDAGIDMDMLSKQIRLSKSSIRRILNGDTIPRKDTRITIERIYTYEQEILNKKEQEIKHPNQKTNKDGKNYFDSINNAQRLIQKIRGTELRYAYEHGDSKRTLEHIESIIMLLIKVSHEDSSTKRKRTPEMIEKEAVQEFQLAKMLLNKDILVFGHFGGGYINGDKENPKSKNAKACNLIFITHADNIEVINTRDGFMIALDESDFGLEKLTWKI